MQKILIVEDEEAVAMLGDKKEAVFVDETNIEKLAELNYPGREQRIYPKKKSNFFWKTVWKG